MTTIRVEQLVNVMHRMLDAVHTEPPDVIMIAAAQLVFRHHQRAMEKGEKLMTPGQMKRLSAFVKGLANEQRY